ncbi:hypothetical protein [Enterococcus sp. LJL51]|uniref:hypothetical protein n=1 Tax=Enterococcus sp. LJL51 TaxID=3416656 RepID=UPI003CEB8B14
MKNKKLVLGLLASAILISACTSTNSENSVKESSSIETTVSSEISLENKIKVPDTLFKPYEEVEAAFKELGLKVEFVSASFKEKAEEEKHFLKKGECNTLLAQKNLTYFSDEQVGKEKAGYYAEKGATIRIGVSEEDFDGSKDEVIKKITGESSTDSTKSETTTSTTSTPIESDSVDTTVIALAVGETGQFSGEIIIGEDLDAGAYDIIPVSDTSDSFKLFKDKTAQEADEYKFEWLFPADEEDAEGDSLKNYVLRSGNILDISTTMEFTRVR